MPHGVTKPEIPAPQDLPVFTQTPPATVQAPTAVASSNSAITAEQFGQLEHFQVTVHTDCVQLEAIRNTLFATFNCYAIRVKKQTISEMSIRLAHFDTSHDAFPSIRFNIDVATDSQHHDVLKACLGQNFDDFCKSLNVRAYSSIHIHQAYFPPVNIPAVHTIWAPAIPTVGQMVQHAENTSRSAFSYMRSTSPHDDIHVVPQAPLPELPPQALLPERAPRVALAPRVTRPQPYYIPVPHAERHAPQAPAFADYSYNPNGYNGN